MKIYESLKDVLSPEQLAEFKAEVQQTIDEAVSEKLVSEIARVEAKAEEYVGLVTEEKVEELTVKAEEFVALQIEEAKVELIKEYDEKLEALESTVVESLDRFLDSEISEKISDELLESVAKQQALLPLVEGMKALFEQHYVAVDTDGTKVIAKLEEEKKQIEQRLSESIAEKMELSELAERAAIQLLIREKTEDLTIGQAEKVKMFFEGKNFDEVSGRVDGYITLISEETTAPVVVAPVAKKTVVAEAKSYEDEGFDDSKLSKMTVVSEEDQFLSAAQYFMD
jgi:hypothetical protein